MSPRRTAAAVVGFRGKEVCIAPSRRRCLWIPPPPTHHPLPSLFILFNSYVDRQQGCQRGGWRASDLSIDRSIGFPAAKSERATAFGATGIRQAAALCARLTHRGGCLLHS